MTPRSMASTRASMAGQSSPGRTLGHCGGGRNSLRARGGDIRGDRQTQRPAHFDRVTVMARMLRTISGRASSWPSLCTRSRSCAVQHTGAHATVSVAIAVARPLFAPRLPRRSVWVRHRTRTSSRRCSPRCPVCTGGGAENVSVPVANDARTAIPGISACGTHAPRSQAWSTTAAGAGPGYARPPANGATPAWARRTVCALPCRRTLAARE